MSEEDRREFKKEISVYSKEELLEKYIDELEENCTLSDLWCKSQEENKRLNNIINELEKMLEQTIENSAVQPHIEMAEYTLKELKELKGSDKE